MNVLKTSVFDKWLKKLNNRPAKAVIQVHINRLIENKLGNLRSLGGGVYEKKINFGPGYRLYVIIYQLTALILLCGGDKSTQQSDIQQAKKLAQEVKKEMKGQK